MRERWRQITTGRMPLSPGTLRVRDLAILVLVLLAAWYHADVGPRGRVDPANPQWHMTDFTVFTEAGAAFLDGRDPYAVTNPRGWFYLYPPLFALTVAPLAALDPVSQVFVWYVVSVAFGFGCVVEGYRLVRWVLAGPGGEMVTPRVCAGIVIAGVLTTFLPTLECLQRGQLGVALLYALLLGFRLAVTGESLTWRFLGGVVLAWSAVVKLIPVLPAAFVVAQLGAVALRRGRRGNDLRRAATVGAGGLTGAALFLLVIPAAVVGWDANARHLRIWTAKVAANPDPGKQAGFHVDSSTNQSLTSAAHSLAITLRPVTENDPRRIYILFARTESERGWARDKAIAELRRADQTTRHLVRVVQGVVVVLLLALALAPPRGDRAGQVAAFGMGCTAMLLISPVAWTHYYMMAVPAAMGIGLALAVRGRSRAALGFALVPAVLVWTHYLAKNWVGPVGLLGLGTTIWFLAGGVVLVVDRVIWGQRSILENGDSVGGLLISRGWEKRGDEDPLDKIGMNAHRREMQMRSR
jgi:hypothetical protein